MKKEFNAPSLDIELFISEDILTDSGTATVKHAHDLAVSSLNGKGAHVLEAELMGF